MLRNNKRFQNIYYHDRCHNAIKSGLCFFPHEAKTIKYKYHFMQMQQNERSKYTLLNKLLNI